MTSTDMVVYVQYILYPPQTLKDFSTNWAIFWVPPIKPWIYNTVHLGLLPETQLGYGRRGGRYWSVARLGNSLDRAHQIGQDGPED